MRNKSPGVQSTTVDPVKWGTPYKPEMPCKPWTNGDHVASKMKQIHSKKGDVIDSAGAKWIDLEFDMKAEPRSAYEPSQLFNEQFTNYWDSREVRFDEAILRRVFSQAVKAFVKGKVDIVPLEFVPVEDKLDKNAGLPSLGKKHEEYVSSINRAKAVSTGRVAPQPCVAFYRTQENNKTRLVWGYPFEMVLLEGRFAQPWMDYAKSNVIPYTVGLNTFALNGRLRSLEWSNTKYCLDWSKFDSTVPRRLIKMAFDVVECCFRTEGWSEQDWREWGIVKLYFMTAPLLMPDGFIYHGRRRGIPSGSWFTQIIGSIVNYLAVNYIAAIEGLVVSPNSVFFGDDAVIGLEGWPDVFRWAKVAETLGMKISVEKQYLTHGTEIHFLGHYWGHVMPTRPLRETLARLATSERYVKHKGKTKEERSAAKLKYAIEKAKSLMVDNPAAEKVILRYVAWRKRVGLINVQTGLIGGDWRAAATLDSGISRRFGSSIPDEFRRSGRTYGEQVLCH